MARRLSIHPRIFHVEEFASLSIEARLLLVAIGTYTDYAMRFRYGPGDEMRLATHCGWAWDGAAFDEIVAAGLLVIADGMATLSFSFGHRRLRVSKWEVIRSRVFERDGFACTYCGAMENLHCDHVIPKARGGSDDMSNLTTACGPCNMSKGAKTLEEWRQ